MIYTILIFFSFFGLGFSQFADALPVHICEPHGPKRWRANNTDIALYWATDEIENENCVCPGVQNYSTDCQTDEDCNAFQHCHFGYCNCEFGYVKNIALQHCFELKKYGDECFFDIQCNDHRMECNFDVNDDSTRHCICDRFHKWRADLNECHPNFNVTELLENLGDGNDIGKHLEREAERIFLGLVIVGLTIVSLLLSFIAICSVYGCCCSDKASGDMAGSSRKDIEEVAVVGLPDAFDDIGGDMAMDFGF